MSCLQGVTKITCLLGVVIWPCIGLVCVYLYIIRILPIIIEDKNSCLLEWFFLSAVITVSILTDSAINTEFQVNFPNISKLQIGLIY